MISPALQLQPTETVESGLALLVPGVDFCALWAAGADDFWMTVIGLRARLLEGLDPSRIIELFSQGRQNEVRSCAQRLIMFDSLIREFVSER